MTERMQPIMLAVARRLHRDDGGAVGVLLVLFMFCLVGLIAMVWNTGEYATRSMKMQGVADTAAYSAAGWNARTCNLVTGSNMVIVRTASAEVIASASAATIASVTKRLQRLTKIARALMSLPHPASVAAGTALMAKLVHEWAELGRFAAKVGRAIAKIPSLHKRNRKMYAFQKAMVAATPKLIDKQRKALMRQYNCHIYLTQAWRSRRDRGGKVRPPLKRGNPTSIIALLGNQVRKDRRGWNKTMSRLILGRGKKYWRRYTGSLTVAIAAATGHHVLVTQTGPIERGPTNYQRNYYFTVIAAVASSRRQRPQPMMPNLFTQRSRNLVAYATAETFNGNEGGLTAVTGIIKPWRVWSLNGFFWRPRLSQAEALRLALQARRRDRGLHSTFGQAGIRFSGRRHDISSVNLH